MPRITQRQFEILELLSLGYSYVKISTELKISYYTVKTHIRNMLNVFGVSNRVQLMQIFLSDKFSIYDRKKDLAVRNTAIKNLRSYGVSCKNLAIRFGLSLDSIHKIVRQSF